MPISHGAELDDEMGKNEMEARDINYDVISFQCLIQLFKQIISQPLKCLLHITWMLRFAIKYGVLFTRTEEALSRRNLI